MLNRTDAIAAFLARKGATVCPPAGENTPRTPVRKFKARKESGEAEAPKVARTPVFFDVGEHWATIVGTARNVAKGRNADDIAQAAALRCMEQVRSGKFYGGDAAKWCATITANVAKNEAKSAANNGHSEANVSGERGDDGDVAITGVVLPAVVEELRAVRAVEVGRLQAFIATLDADVATYVRERIATGSNNEACAAVGWNAVRGSRVWKEFQASAERAVGLAELAPLAQKA